jgi:phosphoribosylformylglycinamidine cyclo-ligase
MSETYKSAGVSIEAGEETVKRIKGLAKSTFNKNVLSDIGMFGGFFEIDKSGYKNPVLVSSVDGVGTKLKIAFMMNKHNTVGQDLVNHCVNDIAVCGAKPLFFLDYLAVGKLKPDVAEKIIEGFAVACKENGCALIGGETAEMPGFYAEDEYESIFFFPLLSLLFTLFFFPLPLLYFPPFLVFPPGTNVGCCRKRRIINGKQIARVK